MEEVRCKECARYKSKNTRMCCYCKEKAPDFFVKGTRYQVRKLSKEIEEECWVCVRCGFNGKGRMKHECLE